MKIGVCEQTIYAEEVGTLYEFDLNMNLGGCMHNTGGPPVEEASWHAAHVED